MGRFWRNYIHLTAVMVLEYRQWLPMLISLTVLLNLGMVFAFSFIAGSRNPDLGRYFVSGAAVMSLVTLGVMIVAGDMAQARRNGTILYYASLPISKTAFILAVVTGNGLAAVPGMVLTVLVGSWYFGFPLTVNPGLLLVVPLSAISLAGLGAAIGLGIKNWRVAGLVAQVTMFFIMFFAPVMIPSERLPSILQLTGQVLPPTYAARAFRIALGPEMPMELLVDLMFLAAFGLGTLAIVARTLKWRLE
jgi:ABC-2 type transport system permease protein